MKASHEISSSICALVAGSGWVEPVAVKPVLGHTEVVSLERGEGLRSLYSPERYGGITFVM